MKKNKTPSQENDFHCAHSELLLSSFFRLTGSDLVQRQGSDSDTYRSLLEAEFCVVSHGTEDDPIFNYGNRAALKLFEMSWAEFTCLPSRKSAELKNREERAKLLEQVNEYGFIDNYRGVRISSSGSRFLVEDSIVWNVMDEKGVYHGQAAVLYRWSKI